MLIIGENIQILSPAVKAAIENRDAPAIQRLALHQVEAGAGVLDLNIGPQKKHGAEIMPWIVEAVQAVTDVPLSLDTTNLAAMEAGLQACRGRATLNSASADPERLDSVMQLAARYGARVIALTMGVDGIPTTTDGRAGIAMESLLPAADAAGLTPQDVLLDPLVLTVTCNQDVAGVAAALQKTMGIGPTDFAKAFSILIASGKAGSVEGGGACRAGGTGGGGRPSDADHADR